MTLITIWRAITMPLRITSYIRDWQEPSISSLNRGQKPRLDSLDSLFRMNFLDSAVVYGVEVLWIYSGYVKLDLFSCSLFQSQEISKFLAMQWDQILAAQSCVQTKQSQYWHGIGSELTRKDLIYHGVHYISMWDSQTKVDVRSWFWTVSGVLQAFLS